MIIFLHAMLSFLTSCPSEWMRWTMMTLPRATNRQAQSFTGHRLSFVFAFFFFLNDDFFLLPELRCLFSTPGPSLMLEVLYSSSTMPLRPPPTLFRARNMCALAIARLKILFCSINRSAGSKHMKIVAYCIATPKRWKCWVRPPPSLSC